MVAEKLQCKNKTRKEARKEEIKEQRRKINVHQ